MRVAYVVSRFPHVSETFILRELEALDEREDMELELFSLFPAVDATIHPTARPWMGRLHRSGRSALLRDLGWWLARRPGGVVSSVALAARGCARRPSILARSLVTILVALVHARTIRDLRVDHVHAHFATYPALTAWVCHRLTGIPYSFTAHAHDLFVDQSFLARKVRDAAFVVAISGYNRRFLERYGGDLETPVHVVHCGIDPAAYRFAPRALPAAGPVRALCVASLQEYKGHAVLLRALAASGPSLDRLQLDLVGGGSLRPSLEALARQLGLENRVRFHGSLPEDEVSTLLERADLFVLPSLVAGDGQMEGLPVALMEALASGAPVVTTRLSGIPELVRDGETGVLAQPGDPASLRAALESVVEGRAGIAASAGRELVESEFDIAASAKQLAALFQASARPAQTP